MTEEKHSLEEAYDMLEWAWISVLRSIDDLNKKDKEELPDDIEDHALHAIMDLQKELAGLKVHKEWEEKQDREDLKDRKKLSRKEREGLR